jgi:beta-galactosidase
MNPLQIIFTATLMSSTMTLWSTDTPRENVLMDFGWRFHLGDAPDAGTQFNFPEVKDLAKTRGDEAGREGTLPPGLPDPPMEELGHDVSFVQPDCDDHLWRPVDLPHDWAVELPFATNGAADLRGTTGHSDNDVNEISGSDAKNLISHGFKPVGPSFSQNSIGWYRKEFDLPLSDRGKVLWLDFEGIYRNSLVWLNGHWLGRHLDGYSSFRYDISRFANCGGKNELAVRVDATRFEGWFYEGAGIYRHVWLVKTSPAHIAPDGIFVFSKFAHNVPAGPAEIDVQTKLINAAGTSVPTTLTQEILDADGNLIAKTSQNANATGAGQEVQCVLTVPQPRLWSPESPNLYRLATTIASDGKMVDRKETEFGIRTLSFDAEKGFLLNGKPYLIKGTCNHQDFAGVGVALPDAIERYRVERLKEMGCNAWRTAHNPPNPELVEACDRLGMLVLDENRRMDTNADTLNDLEGMILRDRNHPSVFLWALGNEEPLAGKEAGAHIAAVMQSLVHHLDPTRLCTVAMYGGVGDSGISTVIDVQGFNYHTSKIEAYHAAHPAQPEIGTETASTVTTRGVYADDKTLGYLSAYGDGHPGWGATPWGWWPFYATHPFASGGFIWTGFDYRGEPTPYKWPCINSHFGLMDVCGFPKDVYYYYQSWWTDQPVLHITPHWNWPGREGKTNLVRIFSNCKQAELFLNRRSLGRQTMRPGGYLDWNVNYEPGTLMARGYDDAGKLISEAKIETAGAPTAIVFSSARRTLKADGEDCSVINVAVVDARNRVVPIADNLIQFELSGPGKIIGVGNGDPSSHEPDKASQRKAFEGWAQVIVQSSQLAGLLQLTASSPSLGSTFMKIKVQ